MKKLTVNCFQSPAAIRLFETALVAERLASRVVKDRKIDDKGLAELSVAINSIADNASDRLTQLSSIYDKKTLLTVRTLGAPAENGGKQ